VRPGLTITAPVTRQINIDDARHYRSIGRYAGYGILATMFLGLLAAHNLKADTVPIWACYDCLVLVTHLPLLNIGMPGRASILLSEIAKILRFSFEPLMDWYSDIDVGESDSPLTNVFMQNGYESTSIIINLAVILAIFSLLIIAIVFAKCIDCNYVTNLQVPYPNGRTEVRSLTATQKVLNTVFRLFMVLFFEIFICTLINFEAGEGSKNDFESISRVISYSMFAISILFILLLFLITAIESDVDRDEKELPTAYLDSLYQGMSLKRRTPANIYLIAYLLRRALYAVVVVMMQAYPACQLFILITTSAIVTAILLRGKPYTNPLTKWPLVAFEFLFTWTCTVCIVFSAEFMHRSYTIATDLANVVCIMTGCVALLGLILLIYSLCWQMQFNMRRKHNLELATELARRPKVRQRTKPAAATALHAVSEINEESEESYRMDRRKVR